MPEVVGSAEMQKDELEVLQFELRFLEGPSERQEQAIERRQPEPGLLHHSV